MKKMLLLFALFSGTIGAQDFKKHLWKHRLLIIYASKPDRAEVQEQLEILRVAREDLKARKLKLYLIAEDRFWYDFSSESQSAEGQRQLSKPYEIALIGLDGGEKYRSDHVQPVITFIELIDQMPMRLRELKNKNKY